MVKKHSEHKGPAPPPPSSVIKSVTNDESQNIPVVLKVQDPNEKKEVQLESEPKELEQSKSVNNEYSVINDSINNNSEVVKQSIDTDNEKNSVSVQSVQLRKHDILNPRPISVAASVNGPVINSLDDFQVRTRRRSSSASNRNQRRPSPPSLDKVLQMNNNIEKNKDKIPISVTNELSGRLQNNQDETDHLEDKHNSKLIALYFLVKLIIFPF